MKLWRLICFKIAVIHFGLRFVGRANSLVWLEPNLFIQTEACLKYIFNRCGGFSKITTEKKNFTKRIVFCAELLCAIAGHKFKRGQSLQTSGQKSNAKRWKHGGSCIFGPMSQSNPGSARDPSMHNFQSQLAGEGFQDPQLPSAQFRNQNIQTYDSSVKMKCPYCT